MRHFWDQLAVIISAIVWWFNNTVDIDVFLSRASLTVTIFSGLTIIIIRIYNLFKKGKDVEAK